ncbi:MAG: DUF6717 family protein [Syntrophobacteria bacterium]
MGNVFRIIAPYRFEGTWVFDDPGVGLEREPFVCGIPEMIDELVKDIPEAQNGFRLLFAASPFPGYQKEISWLREEYGGHWYRLDDPPMEGWLCLALYRYFEEPPAKIFVRAEPFAV